jgi:hypothetical protein
MGFKIIGPIEPAPGGMDSNTADKANALMSSWHCLSSAPVPKLLIFVLADQAVDNS